MPEETTSVSSSPESTQESSPPKMAAQAKSGLDPKVAAALSYLLGFITGIVFLLVEKENKFVRFHALQSTLTFGALFVVNLVLAYMPFGGWPISSLLSVGGVILWIVLMIKAYQGEEFELPVVGKIAREQLGKV